MISNKHNTPIAELKSDILTHIIVLVLKVVRFFRGTFHVDKIRAICERQEAKTKLKLPNGISVADKDYGGVACSHISNQANEGKKLILYLHGGGMCIRMPTLEINGMALFCEKIGVEAILPWYGLAPEHPFPSGMDDCFNVYKNVLEQGYQSENIILAGMSAGGGYCLSVLALIKQNNLPMPACGVLFSPSGDSLMVSDSWVENSRKDPMFTLADIVYCRNLAVSPEQAADPMLNVHLMDDFSGYPPLYLTASTDELLRDVSVIAAGKASAAGIPHQLDLYSGGLHCIHIMRFTRQAKRGWKRIYDFVGKYGFSAE